MGILLVYDVTDEKSFGNIRNWIRNIEQHATESVNKILIGNKCDMLDKKVLWRANLLFFFFFFFEAFHLRWKCQVIDFERGKALADEYGIKFLETSAKNSIGVEEAFVTLAKDIKKRLIDQQEQPGAGPGQTGQSNVQLNGNKPGGAEAPKKGCC